MIRYPSQAGLVEALESRIALSATPLSIGRALDLNDDIPVVLSGHGSSFATQVLGATGQLMGFPSGGDGDFLILSTGIASQVTSLQNTGDAQGTDLGDIGPDSASVSFTLPVPAGSAQQRLKIDFMFLSEEYPEFIGSDFNDTFEVLINGVNYAMDEHGNPIEVDNAYFTGDVAAGTFFDGRTNRLTLTYVVPDGMTSIDVVLKLQDVGDGEVDSAVLVDNVRFESPQVVYLDFDGATLADHFGAGITALIPAFNAADLGSAEPTEALIAALVSKLQEKYALYDIIFTTTIPSSGDFTTLVVGGDNSALLDISGASPLVQRDHPGASVAISDFFSLGADSLLGFAGTPDVGNLDRNDRSVVFSGEFDDFFAALTPEERLEHLVVTMAHELGHNLGLRHLAESASTDVMKQTAPRAIDATFGSTLLTLAEEWSDGVTLQNDHAYLASVLGQANASGLAVSTPDTSTSFSTLNQNTPLFDVTVTITTGDPYAAPITLHFDKLDGTKNLPLPNLPTGAKISISAATTAGGLLNVFSGVPLDGEISGDATFVSLFDANGDLVPIPLAKGSPGSLVASGNLNFGTNDLGDVTIAPTKVITLTDEDGDIYTVKLVGPGMLGYVLDDLDGNGKGGLLKLRLDDTTVGESILSVTVKRGKTGDGVVNFGEITGSTGAGLKSLTASAVNLTGGGIVFSGAIGSVVARDFFDGANLVAGAGEGVKTNITVRMIGDGSSIALGTDVLTFKAARIGESEISVSSLAKLIVAGDKATNTPGDIAGLVTVQGLIGSISARDLLPGAKIEAGGTALERTTIVLHEIMDGSSIELASVVTSLKAARVGDAHISAQQFDSIAVSGDARNFIPGNFAGDLEAINKIGKFVARDVLGTASITAGGLVIDKTSFTARAILDGASITLESSVSTFKAAFVGDADIEVAAIASLKIVGDPNSWLAGDFLGDLTLTGGDTFFVNSLGSASIKGIILDATIVADAIGTLTAGGMIGSEVFAGFTPANASSPLDGGVFFEGGLIKTLSIGTAGFSDSVVASMNVASIAIKSLMPLNGSQSFGFLVDIAPTKVAVNGFTYVKAGPAEQGLEDFLIKVV